jgi:hypothetical protein
LMQCRRGRSRCGSGFAHWGVLASCVGGCTGY